MTLTPTSDATKAPLRVLIADDDPIFTALASNCLKRAGYAPCVARDGADALTMLDCEPFDLAIVDLDMPNIDGFRLIGLVRGAARLRHLGILVISASKDVTDMEEALGLGADRYATKPVNWAKLPGLVEAVLAERRAAGAGGVTPATGAGQS